MCRDFQAPEVSYWVIGLKKIFFNFFVSNNIFFLTKKTIFLFFFKNVFFFQIRAFFEKKNFFIKKVLR